MNVELVPAKINQKNEPPVSKKSKSPHAVIKALKSIENLFLILVGCLGYGAVTCLFCAIGLRIQESYLFEILAPLVSEAGVGFATLILPETCAWMAPWFWYLIPASVMVHVLFALVTGTLSEDATRIAQIKSLLAKVVLVLPYVGFVASLYAGFTLASTMLLTGGIATVSGLISTDWTPLLMIWMKPSIPPLPHSAKEMPLNDKKEDLLDELPLDKSFTPKYKSQISAEQKDSEMMDHKHSEQPKTSAMKPTLSSSVT